ncbi:homoserine O-succinyltransferase [Candidatus Saccharibacteria bacterium]|nr:homoserine O-succinyltransferase [Candidatus Saccharibacteria bacterium]
MSIERSPRLGLLNIMSSPAYLKTEHQWRDALADFVDIVPVRFDDDPRDEFSRVDLDDWTYPISEVASTLDGLIITGANLELYPDGRELHFDRISYFCQLNEVIHWTVSEKRLSVFSCLASHIALKSLVDLDRNIQADKTFGVFEHHCATQSWITSGLDTHVVKAPHSRWGNIDTDRVLASGLDVVADSDEVGWLIAEASFGRGKAVFLQGHPEYQRDDLYNEYRRDQAKSGVPKNYFTDNIPTKLPEYSWADDANILFRNIGSIVTGERA